MKQQSKKQKFFLKKSKIVIFVICCFGKPLKIKPNQLENHCKPTGDQGNGIRLGSNQKPSHRPCNQRDAAQPVERHVDLRAVYSARIMVLFIACAFSEVSLKPCSDPATPDSAPWNRMVPMRSVTASIRVNVLFNRLFKGFKALCNRLLICRSMRGSTTY